MSDQRKVNQTVKWFAERMKNKMMQNNHKRNWRDEPLQDLIIAISTEFGELVEALEKGDFEEIIDECADVANFAMMVADIIRREKKNETAEDTNDS
jgi:NTP pyrophosphatase (non-canonical NTP hydrolase)